MIDDEIAAMRTELAERERRIEALEAELAKLKPPPPEAYVGGPFCMPGSKQTRTLISHVHRRWPNLRPRAGDIDEDAYADMVRAGMLALSHWHRTPGKVDRRWAVSTWRDRACDLLGQIGHRMTTLLGSSFETALICCGDIPYSDPAKFPCTPIYPGVMVGITAGSKAPTSDWVRVLKGELPSDMMIANPPLPGPVVVPHDIVRVGRDWSHEISQ
jgi:hypothetical protein